MALDPAKQGGSAAKSAGAPVGIEAATGQPDTPAARPIARVACVKREIRDGLPVFDVANDDIRVLGDSPIEAAFRQTLASATPQSQHQNSDDRSSHGILPSMDESARPKINVSPAVLEVLRKEHFQVERYSMDANMAKLAFHRNVRLAIENVGGVIGDTIDMRTGEVVPEVTP
jgi:hypothetical protein